MEIHLGPRLILIRERVIGTCDDLHISVAESTWDEVRGIAEADEIILQKYSAMTTKLGEL